MGGERRHGLWLALVIVVAIIGLSAVLDLALGAVLLGCNSHPDDCTDVFGKEYFRCLGYRDCPEEACQQFGNCGYTEFNEVLPEREGWDNWVVCKRLIDGPRTMDHPGASMHCKVFAEVRDWGCGFDDRGSSYDPDRPVVTVGVGAASGDFPGADNK